MARRCRAGGLRNGSEERESITNLRWWQLFEDPTLQQLVGATIVANNDVQVAIARFLEARGQLGIARATQFPQINADASYAYERPFSQNSFFIRGFPGAKASSGNDIRANVDLTFELDVWAVCSGLRRRCGRSFWPALFG